MKIQIDTEKKVLRLESDVNLEEFMTKVKLLFPKGEWKEFTLETNVEINWTNPIYVDRWHYPTYPWIDPGPWRNPFWYSGELAGNTVTNAEGGVWSVADGSLGLRMANDFAQVSVYNVEV